LYVWIVFEILNNGVRGGEAGEKGGEKGETGREGAHPNRGLMEENV